MPITYAIGDMFSCKINVLAHGCNAHGVMGSGVARLIREKYPVAYDTYRARYLESGLGLGTVVWAQAEDTIIANCITQEDFGREPGRVYVDYGAVRSCMAEIDRKAVVDGFTRVAMPLIGAGLAQGHWPTIATIITEEAKHFEAVVFTLDGVIPQ